jgi:hypothetical protein
MTFQHPLIFIPRYTLEVMLLSLWRFDPIPGHGLPSRGFAITFIEHTALGRIPLDEWSARRRDHCLTTHNTPNRQPSMPIGGIRTRNPKKWATSDPRLRPWGKFTSVKCSCIVYCKLCWEIVRDFKDNECYKNYCFYLIFLIYRSSSQKCNLIVVHRNVTL